MALAESIGEQISHFQEIAFSFAVKEKVKIIGIIFYGYGKKE